MAEMIDAAVEARLHVVGCPTRRPTTFVAPTRHCLCVDGETVTLDEMFAGEEFGTPMRRFEFQCTHVMSVRHICPACGFSRAFGGRV